jgi:hypothetical protein
MKYKYIFTTLAIMILFFRCAAPKEIAYNIPSDYPKESLKELLPMLDKGQKLYKANCTGCHGIFTKGQDGVPNFTHTQLDNYSSRFLRGDLKNHAVIIDMSQDQLSAILAFLRFKNTYKIDSATIKK